MYIPSNNAVKLWVPQMINPHMISELWWSKDSPKPHPWSLLYIDQAFNTWAFGGQSRFKPLRLFHPPLFTEALGCPGSHPTRWSRSHCFLTPYRCGSQEPSSTVWVCRRHRSVPQGLTISSCNLRASKPAERILYPGLEEKLRVPIEGTQVQG